jgi:hypothetical protein
MLFSGFVALAILSLLPPPNAAAQGLPRVEHLKVYTVEQQVPLNRVVDLHDQFGLEHVIVQRLEFFSNPVDQNHEGLEDSLTHFSWWRILDPVTHPTRRLIISNKLGSDQQWQIREPTHLLTPALKNELAPGTPEGGLPPPPTHVNHFKCYEATGPRLDRPLILEDQWGIRTAIVDSAFCFCTPVEKILPDGIRYPILDPETHLACYRITPSIHYGIPFVWRDQFFTGTNFALNDILVCVPSIKDEVVPTQKESWGRVKSVYR